MMINASFRSYLVVPSSQQPSRNEELASVDALNPGTRPG
ncbi:hypothetical protein JOF40_002989 [Aeromicrobium fastidiosum]|nr:hypothetical protein [Aeromicrobium fastidiosum]